MRLLVLTLASLWLAGCAVGPDYRQPDLKLPDHWQVRQTGQLAGLSGWWAQFNDPALTTLQSAAQQNSNSLAKATAAIDKARASRTSAEAGLWPSLTASGKATESGSFRNSTGTTRSASAGLDASWELDLFGKTRRNTESADALIAAREADWHDARVSLAAEVATDYVDYRACRIKQKYYEDQAESQARTHALTQLSARAGFTAPADARLAEGSAASTRATALAQKTECEVLVKTLVALTGMDEAALRQTLAQDQPTLPQTPGLKVEAVPANLLRQRPDIVAAERALASSSALIGVAEAARWPSLTLAGSVGLNKTQGANLTAPWSFGPSLSLPIFDGGSISANIKSARADYDSALATYRQTVLDAVKEVEQALVRLDAINEREDALQKSAAGYRAYLTATEQNQKAGGTSLLDLETARRSAIGAEVSLIELQQNRLEYWIALYKAVGGGWQSQQGDRK
jgi:NodT family efflux transporter outer membrane factor (OMF) lipoprotein